MKIFAWVVIGIVGVLLLALLWYLVVGAIVFKATFGKKPMSRKRQLENAKYYNIDLDWWNRYKFEKYKIKNVNGLTLVGHYYDNKSDKTAIIVHGYRSNYLEMQGICDFYIRKGFNILAVEDRAHGESEGKCIGFGWYDRLDLMAWIKHLNELQETKIVLHGLSMGSTAVCSVSGEKLPENVKAIISDCGFSNGDQQFTYVMKKNKFPVILKKHLYSYLKRVHGFDMKDVDATKSVKNTKVPILFIHGNADDFVPVENLYALYNAAPDGKKDKFIVEGAGHALSYNVAGKEYEKKIESFLKTYTNL